jgi:maltose alpha-D-glucosyltransferase / alpha-amylase
MSDPLWYKDAVFYELRIRSFYDSDGDGIGDIRGLTEKLEYLADLGITTLWLLPFYPSPLRDDGYDIAEYFNVHPQIGTLRHFKAFLKEAHKRGLRVVTELVLNHTSDQHPWFQRARRAPAGSRYRDWYVWSDTPDRYRDVRIIFTDTETSNWSWDPVANAYFFHRFFSHQPDLNFDNPDVQKAVLQVMEFWLELGVDGLRLDAVPYLFEREGTACENLPETHDFLRRLRREIDAKFEDRMLLAEANQWPEDAVAYFGQGDECHMCFHFPIMPRLYMALRMEDHFPVLDILEQTPAIPESSQWAIFLRNHDELTLEMVTDEERDYMNRAYAADPQARINLGIRRRLAPLMENNRRRIELMNALLFSLPGTPVLYYGDEIGMGDNVYLGDRNGVRTPMQWSPDRNAGFSRSNPQRLFLPPILDPEYHYEAINVETQQHNPSSLLWWTKRLITLRKQFVAFGRGSFEALAPQNRKILAFIRRYQEEVILVVANLSRFSQYVELELAEFRNCVPLELFGGTQFPPIGERPYLLTLGPHNFYWLALRMGQPARVEPVLRKIEIRGDWDDVFAIGARARTPLEQALESYLPSRRWYRSKARELKSVKLIEAIPIAAEAGPWLVLVEASYAEGEPEIYSLPIAFSRRATEGHERALAELVLGSKKGDSSGWLIDASDDPRVAEVLLETAIKKKRLRGKRYDVVGVPEPSLTALRSQPTPPARVIGAEQSNSSYVYGELVVGKLLRVVELGESVELELLRHLGDRAESVRVPPLAGWLELRPEAGQGATLMTFQRFVPNQGDAWRFTLDEVVAFFERVITSREQLQPAPVHGGLLDLVGVDPPQDVVNVIGAYLETARLLGQRTGELHVALAQIDSDPRSQPEAYTALSRRSYYQSVRNLTSRSFDLLKQRLPTLSDEAQELARHVLRAERTVRARLRNMIERSLEGKRIRVHGDYHLGQVLYTGRDFHIIDFEGEPARTPAERRRRRSPLADVAGMLRSFHYAAHGVLMGDVPGAQVRPEDVPLLRPWVPVWTAWVGSRFLSAYLDAVAPADLLPVDEPSLELLLDVHLIEKSLYELAYELNSRPSWVRIPLRGILDVLEALER